MPTHAIRVSGLGKAFSIGRSQRQHNTLRDALAAAARAPGRWFRRRRLAEEETLWALRDVSFEVGQGEAVGIIGRNGAGKSTLLKLLSRITEPTEGEAEIWGRVGSLLEVGTGFHSELTGRENIFLSGAILGMRRAEIRSRFDEIVAFAETERFLDTPVKYYSSGHVRSPGFRRRGSPRAGDPARRRGAGRGRCRFPEEMPRQDGGRRKGGTYRSLRLPQHAGGCPVCSRAVLLEQGRLVQTGSSAEVVGAYLEKVLGAGEARVWSNAHAPGNDDLRLVSIRLIRNGDPSGSVVSVEDEVRVEVGYRVAVPGLRFRCVAMFWTQGVMAFASMEPTEAQRNDAGLYFSSVTIPPHFLAEGEYSVDLSIFASRGVKMHLVQERDLLVFQVTDPMTGSSARGDYAERYAGVVRPRFRWEMAYGGP